MHFPASSCYSSALKIREPRILLSRHHVIREFITSRRGRFLYFAVFQMADLALGSKYMYIRPINISFVYLSIINVAKISRVFEVRKEVKCNMRDERRRVVLLFSKELSHTRREPHPILFGEQCFAPVTWTVV